MPIIAVDDGSFEDLDGLTACMTSAGEHVIKIGAE